MSVVEAGLPLVGTEEAVECALCEHHRHEPVAPGALEDRRDDVIPWAVGLTVAVVGASFGAGSEQWFASGAIAGLAAGVLCAWITVREHGRRERVRHDARLRSLAADGDDRVAMVVKQYEWAVNDVARLKRAHERAEASADLLVGQARQREAYIRKLERELAESRDRLATLVNASGAPARPLADPLEDALAGVIPFQWALHSDQGQFTLELECGLTSRRPTRVRLVDDVGAVRITSGTPMWTESGRPAFSLADPPRDLVAGLDAGRETGYTFEALVDYEWHPVRLEDTGRRTKVVTDKQGRLYRVSDDPDAAQLLAPTLTTLN